MDTLLQNGSHPPGEDGHPVTVRGAQARLQRLMIRLCVRRGSFAPEPRLGSQLYRLPQTPAAERDTLARHWAQEALLGEGARVTDARCAARGENLAVALTVELGGEQIPLEVLAV